MANRKTARTEKRKAMVSKLFEQAQMAAVANLVARLIQHFVSRTPLPKPVTNIQTRFEDVQGCDEVKGELQAAVAYLRNPKSFTRIGARLPVKSSAPPLSQPTRESSTLLRN